jgi:hypothetical protein
MIGISSISPSLNMIESQLAASRGSQADETEPSHAPQIIPPEPR